MTMMKQERLFEGIWIPAETWLSDEITYVEKGVVAEVRSLSKTPRGCYATNEHFAMIFDLSVSRVSRMIGHLVELGILELEMVTNPAVPGGRQRLLRVLRAPTLSTKRQAKLDSRNFHYATEEGYTQNPPPPSTQECVDRPPQRCVDRQAGGIRKDAHQRVHPESTDSEKPPPPPGSYTPRARAHESGGVRRLAAAAAFDERAPEGGSRYDEPIHCQTPQRPAATAPQGAEVETPAPDPNDGFPVEAVRKLLAPRLTAGSVAEVIKTLRQPPLPEPDAITYVEKTIQRLDARVERDKTIRNPGGLLKRILMDREPLQAQRKVNLGPDYYAPARLDPEYVAQLRERQAKQAAKER